MIRDEKYWEYIDIIAYKLSLLRNKEETEFLITGVTGLLGTVITDILIQMNKCYGFKYKIYGIARNEEKIKLMFDYIKDRQEFSYYIADINEEVPVKEKCQYVIHAASNTHPLDYSMDPIGTITSNVIGTNNMLKYCIDNDSKRFLFLSSVEVYGENRGDVEFFDENYLGYINCNTLRAGYPESKRTGEALCQAYGKKYGLDFVIPRLCRIFGPTMSLGDSKAIAQFIKNAARDEDIVLKSAGMQLFSYIDVFNGAYAVLYLMFNGISGEAYNVAAEDGNWYMKDIAKKLANINNKEVVFQIPDNQEAKGYSTATKALLSVDKIKKLGFVNLFNINEIMEYTVEIIRKRYDKFK